MDSRVTFTQPAEKPNGLTLDEVFEYQENAEKNGLIGTHARWSVSLGSAYVHPMARHEVDGFILRYSVHFGKKPVQTIVQGSTAFDLWSAASQLIEESGDLHHVFIEAFSYTDNPGVIELTTGS